MSSKCSAMFPKRNVADAMKRRVREALRMRDRRASYALFSVGDQQA
jgi:hypothetical protein